MASPATPEYYYSSTAPKMTLISPATAAATTIQVDTVAGLPGTTPFKLVLDPGLSGEEIVKVTALSGTTATVIRGWDGTAAQSHANLSEVRHMVTAEDIRLSREHESSWREVHGVNGLVVGTTDTQTLTNKDLSSTSNAFPASLATDTEVASAVSTHAALKTTHGVVGVLVGTTDVQTLTNKTIDGATNTLTNIPKTAISGLTGSVVDTDSVQTLTNKTISQSQVVGLPAIQTQQGTNTSDIAAHAIRLTALEADSGEITNSLTPSTGWSIVEQRLRKIGRVCMISFTASRTGAAVASNSTGNIVNAQIATIAAAYRPILDEAGISPRSTGEVWQGYINDVGVVGLADLGPGVTLNTGDTISGSATYLV